MNYKNLDRSDITHRGVQYIIDSVVQALVDDPNRRFIYVEIGFFWRWWQQQSDVMRNTVKQLVNEGIRHEVSIISLFM